MKQNCETPRGEREDRRERGSALILVLIMAIILSGLVFALSTSATVQSKHGVQGTVHDQRLILADDAMARAIIKVEANYNGLTTTGLTTDFVKGMASGEKVDIFGERVLKLDDASSNPPFGDWVFVNGSCSWIEKLDSATTPPTAYKITSVGMLPNATGEREVRMIEVILAIEFDTPVPTPGPGAGAVIGSGNISVSGNSVIDGNDYGEGQAWGSTPSGTNDQPGINLDGSITRSGSATVGGSGVAPSTTPADPGAAASDSNLWQTDIFMEKNGVDDDGDGTIDEVGEFDSWAASDGYDNDNDGTTDGADPDGDTGSTNGTPVADWNDDDGDGNGPANTDSNDTDDYDNDNSGGDDGIGDDGKMPLLAGQLLGKPDNQSLRDHAIANRTLFIYNSGGGGKIYQADPDGSENTSNQQYKNWLNSTDAMDGGDVIYVEAGDDDIGSFDVPDNFGGDPSIVIVQHKEFGYTSHHAPPNKSYKHGYADHNISMKLAVDNSAGTTFYKGFIIADSITNTAGNGTIQGALACYNNANLFNVSVGNVKFLFSSEVLANLPGIPDSTTPPIAILSFWREVR